MISVVIPAYNAEKHIRRCLKSVLRQTYDEFEVIVVDDGSSDRTADIVRSFSDSRIYLVQQANRGVSAARNLGVEIARGEWVAFLDSDDEWEPRFLEAVSTAAAQFPSAVAVFTNIKVSVTGRHKIRETGGRARLLSSYFEFVLANRQGMSSSSSLIRRNILMAVGGFPEGVTHGEDVDTWVRVAWSGPIAYVPEALAVYHTETEGSATKLPLDQRVRYPQIVTSFREWKAAGKIPHSMLAASEAYVQRFVYYYVCDLLRKGDRWKARAVLLDECRLRYAPLRYLAYFVGSLVPTKVSRALVTSFRRLMLQRIYRS